MVEDLDVLSVLGQVVPLALAAALSSVPLTATVLILLSPNRHRSALPFLLGSIAGLALVVTTAGLAAGALPAPTRRPSPMVVGTGELLVGVAILAFGVVSVVRWLRSRGAPTPSRWFGRATSLGPGSAFALAVVLGLRPKSLLLGLAAGLAIAAASLIWSDNLLVGGLYVAVAVSTVLVPVVAAFAAPGRVEPWLLRIRGRLERHGALITAVVMVLVGLGIAISGGLRLAWS